MGETKFSRYKRIVEQEREKKVRMEERKISLLEEKERIFAQLKAEIGKPVSSLEEAEEIEREMEQSIEKDVLKVEAILKEEGYL